MFTLSLLLLAACSESPSSVPATSSPEEYVVEKPDSGLTTTGDTGDEEDDPCDEQEEPTVGLSLYDLPVGGTIVVTAVDENRTELYSETLVIDQCGIATPFQDVDLTDFRDSFDEMQNGDTSRGVYVQVLDTATYVFQGVYISENPDEPSDTPISTQWTWSEEAGDYVAVVDEQERVEIGLFMIP